MSRYIQERLIRPVGIESAFLLDGTRPGTWAQAAEALAGATVDVTFTGLGENGHLAYNEPPANFTAEEPFIVVDLAEQTRMRQVQQGSFDSLEDVPLQAVTMSIRQILKSRAILCLATGGRKAPAVHRSFASEVSPLAPASALQSHPGADVYLDLEAAHLARE